MLSYMTFAKKNPNDIVTPHFKWIALPFRMLMIERLLLFFSLVKNHFWNSIDLIKTSTIIRTMASIIKNVFWTELDTKFNFVLPISDNIYLLYSSIWKFCRKISLRLATCLSKMVFPWAIPNLKFHFTLFDFFSF